MGPSRRARNAETAKDLVRCFRSNEKRLDPASYQRADIEDVISEKEGILHDITSETSRANEKCIQAPLDLAYDGQKKKF